MPNSQRITLIVRNAAKPDIDWNYAGRSRHRIAFLDSVDSVQLALGAALDEVGLDVERIIIDRSASAGQFLTLLAGTPASFQGDILVVHEDGTGYLSASGRGGDRVLYAVSAHDVRFYLETHDLVSGRVTLMKSA